MPLWEVHLNEKYLREFLKSRGYEDSEIDAYLEISRFLGETI